MGYRSLTGKEDLIQGIDMKTLQLLARHISRWQQECRVGNWPRNDLCQPATVPGATLTDQEGTLISYKESERSPQSSGNNSHLSPQNRVQSPSLPPTPTEPPHVPHPIPQRKKNKGHSPLSFLVAVVCLTGAMGQRYYNQPKLDVSTKAPTTIKAPQSAKVVDTKTTEENRRAARIGSVPVLKIDRSVNERINQSLQRAMDTGNELRAIAGPFPYVQTSILSTATQLYLRATQDSQWQALNTILAETTNKATDSNGSNPTTGNLERQFLTNRGVSGLSEPSQDTPQLSPAAEQAIAELQRYQRRVSEQDFAVLLQTIAQVRQTYPQALVAVSKHTALEMPNLYNSELLNWSDADWQATEEGIYKVVQRMLAQGIAAGVPKNILRQAVNLHVAAEIPTVGQPLASELLIELLQPNLVQDPERTRLRAEQAAQQVEPVMVSIEQDEVIVEAGEEITQTDFVLLDHFGLSRRGINWPGMIGFAGLIAGAVAIVWVVESRFHPGLRRRDRLLLLLLTLSTPVLIALRIPYTSLPALGLLAGSFYGSAVGATVVALLAGILPIGMDLELIHLLASAAGGLVGSAIAGRLRSREELALLGGTVGLTQGVVYLLLTLIMNAPAGLVWYTVFTTAALQSLAGLAWSVIALGLSPYLEHLFDLVTPIRLAELANSNRPLLKRLAAETPGTFQHTLFVASLAEAAARELRCNVELVRTGTLYHDIGKMHDPLGFIENQMGGPNKHDQINDPWKSAEIIKKHVTEGLVMARKCRLPKAIQAFIPEHQGTMQIGYFYHQAQQLAKKDPNLVVQEADFRYDGPTPQSRETGIVMLADSCEAALRSLQDATPEEALAMVNKILRARWQDHQLDDSGLTRDDLSQIAEIFVRVWQQYNHKRIAYPKAVFSAK